MRYIFDNSRTHNLLQTWASKKRLVTAGYFLWNAGDILQKSQRGLLQSLLYDILSQYHDLVAVIFPLRLYCYDTRSKPWALRELLDAFQQLSNQSLPTMFCFFVDGLDEYDSNYAEIVHIIKDLVASPYIKICLSSRPWNVFLNAFPNKHQPLLLEEQTKADIQLFVDEILGEEERYLRLAREDSRCKDSTKQIVSNAQGVFLWVRLVVNEILRSLGNDDDVRDLQR